MREIDSFCKPAIPTHPGGGVVREGICKGGREAGRQAGREGGKEGREGKDNEFVVSLV